MDEEELEEVLEMEDAIYALEHNYYDTHDLPYIQGRAEEYRESIKEFRDKYGYNTSS